MASPPVIVPVAVPTAAALAAGAAGPLSITRIAAKRSLAEQAIRKSFPLAATAGQVAPTTPKHQATGGGRVTVESGVRSSEVAMDGPTSMPGIAKGSALSVSSRGKASNHPGIISRGAASTTGTLLAMLPASTATAALPSAAKTINRLAIKPISAQRTALSALHNGVGDMASRNSFHDQATSGQNVVPRKAGIPTRSGGRTETRLAAARATGRPGVAGGTENGGGTVAAGGSAAGPGAAPGAQAGMMVTLHGDVMMDGRKMGRMVAAGQTSAASLPTVSASAINLRAMPVFAGTRAPL